MYYEEKIINGILHYRGTPRGEFLVKEGSVANAVNLLTALSEEQRNKIFGYFCKHSGSDNPRCSCWNDE
jgi:hypothetical protein